MNQISLPSSNAKPVRLWNSFSPSTRAALLLSLPFILADAVHYYTSGTDLIVSLPLLIISYLICGALAAFFSIQTYGTLAHPVRAGAGAGIKLWLLSTVVNTLVSFFLGLITLGFAIIMAVPWLLCAPLNLGLAAGGSTLGALIYRWYYHRVTP